MIAVVVSRADAASEHVGEHLRALADWTAHEDPDRPDGAGGGTVYRTDGFELREFDAIHLDLTDVADAFGSVADGPDRDPALLAFASRHSGETGPLLTAHHTGNFGPAEFGGEDRSLARACPAAHRRVLAAFREHAPEGYEVGMECTHHGPSRVGVPSLFVELGSGEAQWEDPDGARAVARAVLALEGAAPDAPREDGRRRHLVGFGGGHYAPRFERVVRETDWAVGHVAADWGLDAMGDPADHRDLLRAAFEESAADYALVDGDYPDLEATVESLGYRVVGETWVRAVTGVPLALAEALEDAVCPVAGGLRFGDPASAYDREREGAPPFRVVDLPTALVAEAQGIDREATREALAGATLAFETTQNGTRVDAEGRAALPADDAGVTPPAGAGADALVDALVAVLRQSYGTVERSGDAVVARETAFDPALARERGVPEGPAFGRLSAGESVEVDGETVDPADVHEERERRFPLDALR